MTETNYKKYFIKDGYKHRKKYFHYDDSGMQDQYQDQVYKDARSILDDHNLSSVYDVGTGSGYKLLKYFNDKSLVVTGSDIEPTLTSLKNNYPEKNWELSDLSNKIVADLIICSDVIEHLVDPDNLMKMFEQSNFKYLLISTPERDAVDLYLNKKIMNGPPSNKAHVREWNFKEFFNYVNSFSFEIEKHYMIKNKAESSKLCQIVIVKKSETKP